MLVLHTPRLIIRDSLHEDLELYHRLLSDPKTMYYLPDIRTHSFRESQESLEFAVRQAAVCPRKYYFLSIVDKAGEYIGQTGYTVNEFTPAGKIVGVGYFLLPEHWGKGYAAEAFREVIRFAFEEDGVVRISCGCLKENGPSERVMRKAGLIREAELKSYTWHDGALKDRMVYRLLREEWLAAQR